MTELLAFLAVSVVVICTPGQDTALTVRNTLIGGRGAGIWTATGVAAGQAVWAIAAASGVAGLLQASEPAFLAVKIAGVAYLLFLAVQAFRSAWRGAEPVLAGRGFGGRKALRQGLISNLGNPKMAAFFVSLLPQFADRFATMLPLGLLFCALTFGWLALYGLAVARARRLLLRRRARQILDAVAGTVFVALGARLLLAQPNAE
jgi:threonine/homoserine/homoserine lactone efflux protein